VQALIEAAARIPCLLCGEIHPLRLHAYLTRKVRSPEKAEDIEIRIVAIICFKAKERGRQYTKRLLPPFVIAFCRISRQGVLDYLRRFPDGRIVYRIASALLGALDRRTIRRHLGMAGAHIEKAAQRLAPLFRKAGSAIRRRHRGESHEEYLEYLVRQEHRAGGQFAARGEMQIPSLVYIHLVCLFERSLRPPAVSLGYVLWAMVFHDTS
jgi:hypothetical protein